MEYIVVLHWNTDGQGVMFSSSCLSEAEEYYEEFIIDREVGDTMVELKKVDESGWQSRIKKRMR